MPGQLSIFAPTGGIVFSSAPSEGSKIYDAMQTALGPAFKVSVDEAETYADAMAFGAAKRQLIAAGQQDDPDNATYLLPALEKDYRLHPMSTDSEHDRRVALKAAMLARNGALETVITAGLNEILGDLFINWRPMQRLDLVEVTTNTTYPAFSPPRNIQYKLIRINDRIFPGSQTVTYTRTLDEGNPIAIGDKVMVDPGRNGIEELVVVTATPGPLSFTATFTKTHDPSAEATTMPVIRWTCNQRHSMVIVDVSVLTNPTLLGRVHEFMRKTMPGVSTWIVCNETSPGYVGPFNSGEGLIGQTPIGNTALPTEYP